MNIHQITVFWNCLISSFGLSIIKPNKNKKSWNVHYGKVSWSLVLILLYAALLYFQVTRKIIFKRVFSHSMVTQTILMGGNLMSNLLRFSLLLNTKNIQVLYKKVIEFDCQNVYTKTTILGSRSVKTLLATFSVLAAYVVVDLTYLGERGGYLLILECYIYPLHVAVVLGQMSTFLFWIRACLQEIHQNYIEGLMTTPNFLAQTITNDYTLRLADPQIQKGMIRKARKLYHDLHEISCLVNKVYAGPVSLMLGYNLLLAVIYTYSATYFLRKGHGIGLAPYHWMALTYATTFSIIHPFHTTSSQAGSLVINLHKVNVNLSDGNAHVLRELQDFAFQIQQESLQFSPYGMFDIKHNIMLAMFSAVVTYLVVCTQFNIAL